MLLIGVTWGLTIPRLKMLVTFFRHCTSPGQDLPQVVQGYLAHKKQPPPLGPPQGPGHSPTGGS